MTPEQSSQAAATLVWMNDSRGRPVRPAGPLPVVALGPSIMKGIDYTRRGQSSYVGPTNRRLVWQQDLAAPILSSPTVSEDGSLTVPAGRQLYRLSADGSIEWSHDLGVPAVSSPALGAEGNAYLATLAGHLVAVDATGQELWKRRLSLLGGTVSSPALVGSSLYVGSGFAVHAFDVEGERRWRVGTGGLVTASPAIDRAGTVYAGSWDGHLYAIAGDGELRWTRDLHAPITGSPLVTRQGTVVVGTVAGTLHGIEPDGQQSWSYFGGTGAKMIASPALARDGTVYIGSKRGFLHAVSTNGERVWRRRLGGVVGTPTVGADGVLYVTTSRGKLWSVSPRGEKLWRRRVSETSPPPAGLAGWVSRLAGTPVIGASGALYVGSGSGLLRSIGATLPLSPGNCENRVGPTFACACASCLDPLDTCQGDNGCWTIAACARQFGCTGIACMAPNRCLSEIQGAGGLYSPAMRRFNTLAACLPSGCGGQP